MTAPATPRPVDVHALPAMLTALRLPSFQRHWQALAERADAEGWPASRFLAALTELELAERDARRIQRHLQQSQLPGGKTLATLDFKVLPGVTRARVEALAAGDWIETGLNFYQTFCSCGAVPDCDITGDGMVNGTDLAALLGVWGTANPAADLDGDGTVGGGDLAMLLGCWN